MEEIDIWRTAKQLIEQHGEDADIVAAQRIDALMASGDIDGRIAWRRIYFAIGQLQAKTRPRSSTKH